jgi:hypothetical protein
MMTMFTCPMPLSVKYDNLSSPKENSFLYVPGSSISAFHGSFSPGLKSF